MNKLILLALVVFAALADRSCHGQDWRDPAFQQPLPQYYPPNRYPLGELDAASSAIKMPSVLSPEQSNAVKSFGDDTGRPTTPKALSGPKPDKSTPADRPTAKRLPPKKPATQKKATKKPAAKKTASKTDKKKKKAKPAKPSPPVITYDIYRDGSRFPIDPRKPCSVCRRPVSRCNCGVDHGQCRPGNQGQPYQDKEPGGYACGKNCPDKRPMFSVYWPRPFSAKRAERHPHRCNCNQCMTRINDRFDHLINFKLIDYQRTDNGHCGPGADPYGCLGESKYQGLGISSFD